MNENLKFLLCEDDPNLGMLLREYLNAKGYASDLFYDGEAGYDAFLHNNYDMCILDVMMPKKDGFTLAADIRQHQSELAARWADGKCQYWSLNVVVPVRIISMQATLVLQ